MPGGCSSFDLTGTLLRNENGHFFTEPKGPAHTKLPRFQKVRLDRKRFHCPTLLVTMSGDTLWPIETI